MRGAYVSVARTPIEQAEFEMQMKAGVDHKVQRRLLPALFVAALMCYLDRTNLSFAALDMNKDLGLSDSVYGIGAGIFFATYATFGVPGSVFVKRVGARIGMPIILVAWGLASGSMAFIQSVKDFYVLRLFVGAAEAGFFPAVIYYLTLWFAEEDMGLSYTIVMTSTAVSGIVGGPLAGVIMTYLDGAFNLRGWRWLFIAEAIPTILLGLFFIYYLDSGPEHARFLTSEEKEWLIARQRQQLENRDERNAARGLTEVLRMQWIWIIIGIWLLYSCGYYGIIFWLPLLLKSVGSPQTIVVGFLSAIPYVASGLSMILVAKSSDRSRERRLHLALASMTSAIGFFGASAIHSFFGNLLMPLLLCLSAAASGVWAMFGPYWGIPTSILSGDTAAAGFALINSVGVIGGYVGPFLVGQLKERTGSYDTALALFGAMMTLSGTLALCLRVNIGSPPIAQELPKTVTPLRGVMNGVKYADEESTGSFEETMDARAMAR